jgi:predicted esterase
MTGRSLDVKACCARARRPLAALAILRKRWPAEKESPLAFGGFSGGSKYTGWLTAAFVSRGRNVMGVYLSGCNENALLDAARHFDVLDGTFRKIPVFLQSGMKDTVSTPDDHRRIAKELERAGFENVRIQPAPGGHEVVPELLGEALDWFALRRK